MTSLEITLTEFVVPIVGAFLVAYLVHRLADRIAGRFVRLGGTCHSPPRSGWSASAPCTACSPA